MSEKKVGLTQMNLYAVTEISRRYPNVRAILSFTQSIDLHKEWIEEKFDVYTWIKDSVEDLLIVTVGKREDADVETASSILDFIDDILYEVCSFVQYKHIIPSAIFLRCDYLKRNHKTIYYIRT